jgi:hypothetical protein
VVFQVAGCDRFIVVHIAVDGVAASLLRAYAIAVNSVR